MNKEIKNEQFVRRTMVNLLGSIFTDKEFCKELAEDMFYLTCQGIKEMFDWDNFGADEVKEVMSGVLQDKIKM